MNSHTFLTRIILIFTVVGLWACSPSDRSSEGVQESYVSNGTRYGGLFKMNISEEIRSIFPLSLVDASAFNVMNQVYEGLVRFDAEADRIAPALAESYSVDAEGLVYTFHIRQGVHFHDDAVFENGTGRLVTAHDAAYCLSQLLTPSKNNQMSAFMIDLILDGRGFYERGGADSTVGALPKGIRVLDDHTLEIELNHPTPAFLTILTHSCCWIYPRELMNYGEDIHNWCIGTGPFRARIIKMNELVILERNAHYWMRDEEGQPLPYLDAVRCSFIPNDREQIRDVRAGYMDVVFNVPPEQVTALESELSNDPNPEFEILTFPGLRVEYYGFQNRGDLFSDERLRKAFNYAIDREFLVDSVLKGNGDPAIHGFVPPAMPRYSAREVYGYTFHPDSARRLLAEAGYPNGENFPVLPIQVNDGDETVLNVAETIQTMLSEVLNITVELSILPRDSHYEMVENGQVDLWRDGWIADYPDPENFLKLFHGKLVPDDTMKASYLNSVRFKNPEFDRNFEKSMSSVVPEQRRELMLEADRVVVEHAAVLPLYYPRWTWLVSTRIRDLEVTGMGHLDLSKVYIGSPVASLAEKP